MYNIGFCIIKCNYVVYHGGVGLENVYAYLVEIRREGSSSHRK